MNEDIENYINTTGEYITVLVSVISENEGVGLLHWSAFGIKQSQSVEFVPIDLSVSAFKDWVLD